MMMLDKTYVYDGVEVRKTGRVATRTHGTLPYSPPAKSTLVEITPVDSDMDWKKWVDPRVLFTVDSTKKEE
jgi:hypothetical protein